MISIVSLETMQDGKVAEKAWTGGKRGTEGSKELC